MRILFLSHYFPPEVNAPASRTFEHCRHWVSMGHDVTVVTCAPNHPRGCVFPGYRNRLFAREVVDGIRVIRLWTYVTANEGFFRRTLNYFSYMVACIVAAGRYGGADVVVSTSPQFFNGLAGYFVSRLLRAPWVLEIRDLWPESILAVGAIRNRALIGFLGRLESFAYRHADRIVSLTNAFCEYMIGRGVPGQKIMVIKNGVDLKLFEPGDPPDAAAANAVGLPDLADRFVASYVGTHGMAHHLETLLDAARILGHRDDIALLLVGDGAERRALLDKRDAMGLTNVYMLGQQPRVHMPAIWRRTNVSLVPLRRSPLFRTVIPSKIFESMAMEKPIILGVEGESCELVQASGAGICVTPQDSAALADAIVTLCDDPTRCSELGRNGRACVEREYDRRVLAERFASLLTDLATRGNRT